MANRSLHILILLTLAAVQTGCGALAPTQRRAAHGSAPISHPDLHWDSEQLEQLEVQSAEPRESTSVIGEAALTEWDDSRLVLYLGAGEAPYDDGLPSNDLQFTQTTGFSDSSVYLGYEAGLASRVSWFSNVYATRYQSQSLVETLEDGNVAWVTVGLRFAW
ncbi:MAG: hypothetical protein ACI8QC_001086 [Planctomycetota bacterium]|jgi:hypothetical protein